MTIVLIMLVQALPVYIVARIFKNGTFVTLSAIFMSLLAIATGSPAYAAVDIFGIGVAYWIGMMHIAEVKNSTRRESAHPTNSEETRDEVPVGDRSEEAATGRAATAQPDELPRRRSGGAAASGSGEPKAPSDLLKLPDDRFIASLAQLFRNLNENALIMTLVAYHSQKIMVAFIDSGETQNGEWPKSLDELIRVSDPFVNKTPDEIASARRYWFTIAGLLIRAERMAPSRADATELCVAVWISMVKAARLIPNVLARNQLWSSEEKQLVTLDIAFSKTAADCMLLVHNNSAPEFVRHDARMVETYWVTVRGMGEAEWKKWQAEKRMASSNATNNSASSSAVGAAGVIANEIKNIVKLGGLDLADAEFLALVRRLDSHSAPDSIAPKVVVDVARNDFPQHFNDILLYLGWRDKKLVLKPEIESALLERLGRLNHLR